MKRERNLANRLFLIIMLIDVAVAFFFAFYGARFNIDFNINILLSELAMLLPALLFIVLRQVGEAWRGLDDDSYKMEDWDSRLHFRRVKISTMLMSALYMILLDPLMTLCNAISMLFVDNTMLEASGDILDMPFWVMFLGMAVFGPFCEEFIYRGVIHGGYKRSVRPLTAVIFSALLFGLMHLNLNQFSYAFVIGILLALLMDATDSIWPTFLGHAIINAKSVCAMFIEEHFYGDIYEQLLNEPIKDEQLYMLIGVYAVISVVTTCVAGVVLVWIAKNEGRENPFRRLFAGRSEKGVTIVTPSLIIGLFIAIAIIVMDTIGSI